MNITLDVVIAALKDKGCDPTEVSPNQYAAQCPVHRGNRRNLSVTVKNGKLLCHCHHKEGGRKTCAFAEIMRVLGLEGSDEAAGDGRAASVNGRPSSDSHPGKGKGKTPKGFKTPENAARFLKRTLSATDGFIWYYLNEKSECVYVVIRFDTPREKTYRPLHLDARSGRWRIGDPKGRTLLLYQLPSFLKSNSVFVVEGEKCVDKLIKLGIPATTSPHGAGSPHKADWTPLAGKRVVILPDHDEAGEGYAQGVLRELCRLSPRPEVRILNLPEIWKADVPPSDADDIEQWLSRGVPESWEPDQCRAELIRAATEKHTLNLDEFMVGLGPDGTAGGGTRKSEESEGDGKKETQFAALLRLAEVVELFHTPDNKPFGAIPIDGHVENYPIRSTSFRRWLMRAFYGEKEYPPSSEALQGVLAMLEARAEFDGNAVPVYVRVAPFGSRIILDLCDQEWRTVLVGPDGWQVLGNSPVRFRRLKGLLPFPVPESGGSIADLDRFVNLGSHDDWLLLIAVLTAYLRPSGPYPVLGISGEQGSAKSTQSRVIRRLTDPSIAETRAEPREVRDLMIAATNSWAVVLDNISHVSVWLSDAICRLATGGGFATRTLYTDDEETIFDVMRPVILNGISDFVDRPDLIDRCVFLHLPTIPDKNRREESTLWDEFEDVQPRLLGAVLNVMANAMKLYPDVRLDRLPRMADFARWGEAVARALGEPPGVFLKAYLANRHGAADAVLENCPVVAPLCELVESSPPVTEYTATDLLEALSLRASEKVVKSRRWPKSPRTLSSTLRRLAPALRAIGITLVFDVREPGRDRSRLIVVERLVENAGDDASDASDASKGQEVAI